MSHRFPHTITAKDVDPTFIKEIKDLPGGKNILDCIQCGVCSGSCPARFAMDYSPMQILKMAHLGLKQEVLSSHTIWICASCYTCASRCPRGLNIPAIMSGFKNMALKSNIQSPVPVKPKFHKAFAEIVGKYGRMHEAELKVKLANKTSFNELLGNASLGFRMLRKGKLKLRPSKLDSSTRFAEIFKKAQGKETQK
ncbi:MAG TPA: 4Fe-4S dicluster domain-containing protein [Candidatus Bathyarchaeia archaeon]|nr:4Fe-4S dicluster domain-containing protein [Candidatus Bathyarchaeia archaeon]